MNRKESLKSQRRTLIEMSQAGCKRTEMQLAFCRYYEDFCSVRSVSPTGKYQTVWNQLQECILISLECCDVWTCFTDGVSMGMFILDLYGMAIDVIDKYSFEYMEPTERQGTNVF